MIHLNTILYPTDFSACANQALPHAMYLAEKYRARLILLNAVVLNHDFTADGMPGLDNVFNQLKENAVVKMSTNIKDHDFKDLDITKVFKRGFSAKEVLLDYIQENNIDLVVMGTHGRHVLEHVLLGSVAEEVIRVAKCPVLTIREEKAPKPIEKINNVLVPIDFSPHSEFALKNALRIAKAYGANIQLLHVFEEISIPQFYNISEHINESTKAHGKKALSDLFGRIGDEGIVFSSHTIVGNNVPNEIFKFAKENDTDLIVIATHGLTALKHFFLGSVAQKVVRRAQCPVFTVKPFGKSLID